MRSSVRMMLEPWSVKAALGRLGDRRLTPCKSDQRLYLFVSRPGRVLSRDAILEAVANGRSNCSTAASTRLSVACGVRSSPTPRRRGSSSQRPARAIGSTDWRQGCAPHSPTARRNLILRSLLNPSPERPRRRRGRPIPPSQAACRDRLQRPERRSDHGDGWRLPLLSSPRYSRTSDPAWARRAVAEGVRSCPRAGCGRSARPVR
jgi:hypothetical protein